MSAMADAVLSAGATRSGRWATAIGATIVLALLAFICDRIPHSFGNEEMSMKKMRLATLLTNRPPQPADEDILAVNIAYDRQLTPITDEYGLPCGEIDVTDREKLTRFLSLIKDVGYKAIAIDVFFDEGLPADGDTALFSLINNMPRTVVPDHTDAAVNPMINTERLGAADYDVNLLANNFSKYRFRRADGLPSMASRLFEHTGGKTSTGSAPCLLLPLERELSQPYNPESGDKIWYNLGADILDCLSEEETTLLCKDKVIIIGDFSENDMHDTYIGETAGPAILINALLTLREGRDRINLWSVILTVAIYFLICLTLVFGKSIWDLIGWHPATTLNFILSFFGFEAILGILQMLQFTLFTEFHDTFLVSLFFSGFSIYCQKLNESTFVNES